MRFFKGFVVGALIAGCLAFAAGYNQGRGAPLLSNPFTEHSVADDLREAGEQARDATRKLLDRATGG